MRFGLTRALAGLLAVAAVSARGFEVRLEEDRLTLKADHAPLKSILRELARTGVRVRVDPRIDRLVAASYTNADAQIVLDEILGPNGYVLIWDVVEGPFGPLTRLAEIQLFRPGDKKSAEPLPGFDDNFAVDRGATGGQPPYVRDEVLLGFKPGTPVDAFRLLLRQIGGTVIDSIPELGIYRIRLPQGTNLQALIDQLQNNPLIANVEPNYITPVPAPAGEASPEPAAAIGDLPPPPANAPPLAILDSGLSSSAGLSNVVAGRFDALNPDRPLSDTVGHGTQMALIAAGAVQPDGQAGGAGQSVPLLAVRAFDDNGHASQFSLMRSLSYAISKGARVVNMSWGTETKSDFLASAIAYAQSKGAVIVAAAGNEPTGRAMYPASYAGVVAVSALAADGTVWKQSNRGDFVTLSAPGEAQFPVGHKGPPGSYAGTSIASAYTARALAQYFSKHPGATAKDAVAALKGSLTAAGQGYSPSYGWGSLDSGAVQRLLK